MRVPRLLATSGEGNSQTHVFCDVSERAYGAALYVRTTKEDNALTRLAFSREIHGQLLGRRNTFSYWGKGTHGQMLGQRNTRSSVGAVEHSQLLGQRNTRSAAGAEEHAVRSWGKGSQVSCWVKEAHGQLLGQSNTQYAAGAKNTRSAVGAEEHTVSCRAKNPGQHVDK